ncbi:MAG TPA: S8 family serine peptidase [Jatrophihabitans sp.]|jgi:serine protease AprX|uniref:S8 family serine peptidase n=1 Tax=Jatrophihabitans sp. TaxID=1932789 RepID=UPI002DF8036C|nr:S8 family serine peptidase [Jatrophihabitans sp.]
MLLTPRTSVPRALPARRTVAVGLALAAGALGLTAGSAAAAPAAGSSCSSRVDPAVTSARSARSDVIVVGRPGADAATLAAVRSAGGHELRALPMVDGVRAVLPTAAVAHLGCAASVLAITPNSSVRFQSRAGSDADLTSTSSDFVRESGVVPVWKRGDTGRGIGVAVIDTGISPMGDVAGRVVYGPDLSGEGTYIDTYGHGTVMGGIIGGNGAAGRSGGDPRTGVAPGATLVSVKVAGRNGATDVSTVLAAMHWVSAYASEFNIRVLNLSWGTPSTQSPTVDPLDYAVERLWQQGIVVVVAAGNSGPQPGSVLKPADDPMVITAGAYQAADNSTTGADSVTPWSSSGPTSAGYAKPDLVAPGRTIVALRSYGSQVEADNPNALVAPSYIKGSGTSEAAAVTSGAVAVLLQARPDLTPDQVKRILTRTARPIAKTPVQRQGAGRLDLAGALGVPGGPAQTQTPVSNGLGSLEASRGGHNVQTDCNGVTTVIQGEIDVRCQPWDGASWTGASWTGASWTGASWTGASWTGASWTGGSWTGASWTGASWTGASWTGGSWFGASWTGASWTGASWTGASWTGASWTGASWTGASWTGGSWSSGLGGVAFLTAWWGDEPAPGLRVIGETSS